MSLDNWQPAELTKRLYWIEPVLQGTALSVLVHRNDWQVDPVEAPAWFSDAEGQLVQLAQDMHLASDTDEPAWIFTGYLGDEVFHLRIAHVPGDTVGAGIRKLHLQQAHVERYDRLQVVPESFLGLPSEKSLKLIDPALRQWAGKWAVSHLLAVARDLPFGSAENAATMLVEALSATLRGWYCLKCRNQRWAKPSKAVGEAVCIECGTREPEDDDL